MGDTLMIPRIGATVGGYRLERLLGTGGMSRVYLAEAPAGRRVAVKFIRTDRVAPEHSAEMQQRFAREIGSLARLQHPNILRLLDAGAVDGVPYLVTDYLAGGSLRERVGAPLAWDAITRLMAPIARALEYAHDLGVIHRDLKPSNILFSEDGIPVLADFGLARLLQRETGPTPVTLSVTGVGLGTPEYMAPEQARGHRVDHRADVYAFGVILYELATGRRPFESDSPMGLVIKHLSESPVPPRRLAPEVPVAAERLILRTLAKDPRRRPATFAALAQALEPTTLRPIRLQRLVAAAGVLIGVAGLAWVIAAQPAGAPGGVATATLSTRSASPPPATPRPPTAMAQEPEPPAQTPLDWAGRVLWGDQPVPELSLTLTSADDGRAYPARTGADGRFQLAQIQPGTYAVSVEDGPFAPTAGTVLVSVERASGTVWVYRTDLTITARVELTPDGLSGVAVSWTPVDAFGAGVVYEIAFASDSPAWGAGSTTLRTFREAAVTADLVLDPAHPVTCTVRALLFLNPDNHEELAQFPLAEGTVQITAPTEAP